MGMTPDEYLQSFVEDNLADCQDDPGSLRRAFNAAVSASHLADHYYNYNLRHSPTSVARFPTIGSFIEHLATETGGAFRDLRSISNVYKHLYTNPEHRARSSIMSGGALVSVQLSEGEVGELDAEHEGDRSFVQFTRKDGTKAESLPALESFVSYWFRNYAFQNS